MRVKCESCGTLHEVDARLAPASGSWPTCPLCAPPIGAPLDDLFDLGAPNLDPLGDDPPAALTSAVPAAASAEMAADPLGHVSAALEGPPPLQRDDLLAMFGPLPPAAAPPPGEGAHFGRPGDLPEPVAAPAQADDLFALLSAPLSQAAPPPSGETQPALGDLFAEDLAATRRPPAEAAPGPRADVALSATGDLSGGGDPLDSFGLGAPPQLDPAALEGPAAAFSDKFEPFAFSPELSPIDIDGAPPQLGQIPGQAAQDVAAPRAGPEAQPKEQRAPQPPDDALLSFEAARGDLAPMDVRAPKAGLPPEHSAPSAHGDPSARRPRATGIAGVETSKIALFGLLVIAVTGALIWLWFYSDAAFRRDSQQAPPPAVAQLLEAVRRSSPETIAAANRSSADEHVQRGLSLLQDDTASSYALARASFVQALVLDPARADAIALYVEATLHVRPSEPYLESAHALIELALAEAPDSSLPHRVRALLLMQEEQQAQAISEAEQAVALALPEERADALLMLGYALLDKSAPVALEKIDQAVQRNPRLKRALYYQGLAAESAGELLQAVKAYEARLSIDAKERDSLQGLIRVYLKLGRHEDARAALKTYLKAYGSDGAPRLWEIALALRFEKGTQRAGSALRRIEEKFSRLTTPEKRLFHRLNAEYLIRTGDLAGARKSVEAALRLEVRDAAAHFQGLQIALLRRDPLAARQHLEACQRQLAPGLYQEYLGRIALLAGDADEALRAFQKANGDNPRRLSTLLMEGVLLLRRGEERAAWALHGKILELDPRARAREPAAFDDFHTPERAILDLARPLLGRPQSPANSSQWLYLIYGALLGFHSGETAGPARAFDQVISGDPTSLISFAYRAQIELDRGALDRAQWFIDTAISFEPRAALPHYLRGRLNEQRGDARAARAAYLKALEFSPRLVDAEIQLAQLSMSQGDRADATRRLRRVLLGNPHLERVRAMLFELERDLPAGR